MTFIVAIDGPAGTGKSTISQIVAKKLNLIYVDTGAFYRALAYVSLKNNTEPSDISSLVNLVSQIKVVVDDKLLVTKVLIGNHELKSELRSEEISKLSSVVSQHKEVREELLQLQRDLALSLSQGAIFEGRDITTVVFPKALVKIFICADAKTRAQRRFLELKNKDPNITLEEIIESIEKRDERDKNRPNSPMHIAKDAHVLDTSLLSIEDSVQKTLDLITIAKANYKKGNSLW